MSWKSLAEIAIFMALAYLVARFLGGYIYSVFGGRRTRIDLAFGPLERLLYRLAGVDPQREQRWFEYALSLAAFNGLGIILLILVMALQHVLPGNPQRFGQVGFWLSLNTAVSFVTNTNWQAYAPESTMSYFTQAVGLTVQNFLSAATGLCTAVALIRGFTRRESGTVGNFWSDLVRGTVYILLPISVAASIVLISQGVPQNLDHYARVTTIEGRAQSIPQGPVASQEAIKMLGTNGGGFFTANSGHPYENPTPLTNLLEMLLMMSLPAGLIFAFGRFTGDFRQGQALFNAVFAIILATTLVAVHSESKVNPSLTRGLPSEIQSDAAGGGIAGNLEGKETRFGVAQSVLFSVVTTSLSCGAVNNAHDSGMPITGLVEMFNMQLGELVFGGIGSGLYTLLLFAVLTVFVAGLMVGRTPEYLGKKIGPLDMQLTVAAVLFPSALILVFTGLVVFIPSALKSVSNPGAHGFSQLLYAYTSASQNNGSAFSGLNANTAFWNSTLAVCMLLGRFVPLFLVLKLAGGLAAKKATPVTLGTLPTNGLLFSFLLIAIIIVIGGLTFFPALAIGPLVEHLTLFRGFGL